MRGYSEGVPWGYQGGYPAAYSVGSTMGVHWGVPWGYPGGVLFHILRILILISGTCFGVIAILHSLFLYWRIIFASWAFIAFISFILCISNWIRNSIGINNRHTRNTSIGFRPIRQCRLYSHQANSFHVLSL